MKRRSFVSLLAATPIGAWLMSKSATPVIATEKPIELCSRCGIRQPIVTVFEVTSHTWFTPSRSNFAIPPPRALKVCGDCLTDNEILRERAVADVVLFATGVLLENGRRYGGLETTGAALETVRAYFQVYSNEPVAVNEKQRQKDTVVRLLGATNDNQIYKNTRT